MTLVQSHTDHGKDVSASLELSRPENRRRRAEAALWCDTLPSCFRSEAFAEDLPRAQAVGKDLPLDLGRSFLRGGASSARIAAIMALTRILWSLRTT